MGLALYRKYRPKGLASVVGQDHIVKTLQNALKSGKISHAYLFTGPRGVGKTSVARILAHEINGLEYTDDSVHLDIIEIDAASNRRIDEIRDLRDKVHIAPTSAKYKVYIIDEVHMLTREAFNALLKTLEEPPAHAVFILATTEAHKVPETIASRTQRFTFKPITSTDTVGHLKDLAKQEKINITDEALEALAEHASGSFRDSINLLDQMIGTGDSITKDDIELMLGLPNPTVVAALYDAAQASDVVALTQTLTDSRISGLNAGLLAKALGAHIRAGIISSKAAPDDRTTKLLRQLITAAGERDAFAGLELALFDYIAVAAPLAPSSSPAPSPVPKVAAAAPVAEVKVSVPKPAKTPVARVEISEVTSNDEPPIMPSALTDGQDFWAELLQAMKRTHNTLYGIMRMAQPSFDGDELTLSFKFAFHQKQMTQANNQKRIADAASALVGRPISVVLVHDKNAVPVETGKAGPASAPSTPNAATSTTDTPSPLTDISSVFTGAELLE